ncbi:site-specific DNA-methyltransferase [Empedobacter falsenii]
MSTEQDITHNIQAINPNLEKLKQAFPHCFDKNGDFDFAKFKAELDSNDINIAKEGYSLDWLGKSYARVLASDAATTLLKEDEIHNAKPENANSQNLLIKGDNLEVLKHLSNAYYEKVKMIYIDPPYNTGDDFVYNDDRKFTAKQLQDLAGVSEDEAKRILEFTQSNSNSHSAWLTFMYPRLYIAKQLLKDDGVIFVSIDDNEVAQLRLLMDEVFGEENFVGQWNWFKSATPPNLSKKIKKNIEYILAFQKGNNNDYFKGLKKESKSDDGITKPQNTLKQLIFKSGILNTSLADGTYKKGVYGTDKYPNELLNDLIVEDGKNKNEVIFQNRFTWTQDKLNEEIANQTRINLSKSLVLSIKKADYKPEVPPNFIDKNVNVDTTENAGRALTQIFGKEKVFDYPKPVSLIKYLINFLPITNDDLILDFFAGSGTTAHAVMQLNAEDGGNRQFILVQLPELIDLKKNKTAYDFVKDELGVTPPTIFEITKERIIRAANQINAEIDSKIDRLKNELPTEENKAEIAKYLALKTQNAFKIFETTPIWEDYDFKAEKLANAEKLFDDEKLTEADVKALFTTWKTYDGSQLTEPVQEVDLAGYKAYYTKQKLYLMHKGFSTVTLKALLEQIDADANFNPTAIIAFGYYFESKSLREIAENIKTYNNKKNIDIDFITRY